MPHTHTRTFRVRYYECDAHGHLNNANYLRYMQETAFDASAAAGYDLKRYNQMQRLWLIRESGIEYLCPLRYDDQVVVKTWVADFQHASSRRVYEFYRLPKNNLEDKIVGEGQISARAYTDWVLIDTARTRPTSIPSELKLAFYPEGIPNHFPPREPFPNEPAVPPKIFKTRLKVGFNDLDGMQHVNNAVYLNYVTECGMQAIAAHGWPWERLFEAGFGIYLRHNRIQYLQPAVLDDELEISTWISNVRRATANRHYLVQRVADGELLARVITLSAWVDFKTGNPIRIPKDFLADFAPNITKRS